MCSESVSPRETSSKVYNTIYINAVVAVRLLSLFTYSRAGASVARSRYPISLLKPYPTRSRCTRITILPSYFRKLIVLDGMR